MPAYPTTSLFGSDGAQAPAPRLSRRPGSARIDSTHFSGSGMYIQPVQPNEREASGIYSVNHVKRVPFEHKPLDPMEKLALEQARYHSETWAKKTTTAPFVQAAAFKLNSDGAQTALRADASTARAVLLDDVSQPVKDATGALHVPSPGRRRLVSPTGAAPAAWHDHIRVVDGSFTAEGPLLDARGQGPVASVSPSKAKALSLLKSEGTASAIAGFTAVGGAEDRGAVAGSKARTGKGHYSNHLAGGGVGSLLLGPEYQARPSTAAGHGERGSTGVSSSTGPDVPPDTKVLAAPRPGTAGAGAGVGGSSYGGAAPRPGTAAAAAAAAKAGSEAFAALRPTTAGGSDHFTTVTRATYTGAAQGGPRERTPPRRKLHSAAAGPNDPYRKTSIY